MKFLAYNSPFMSTLGKIVDYMLLGLLWFFTSLPIITFGAATTAMLLTAEISLRKEEGKIAKTFFKHFKKEFKQATVLLLIQLPMFAILATNLWLLSKSESFGFFEILIGVASWAMICWIQLWFAYLSKFKDGVKMVLKNTFRIALSNLGRTSVMALVIVAALLVAEILSQLMPPLLLVIPGVFIMAYTTLMRSLFNKVIKAYAVDLTDVPAEP